MQIIIAQRAPLSWSHAQLHRGGVTHTCWLQILFACIAGVMSVGWAACEAYERLHPVRGPSFGVTLRTMDE